MLDASGVCSNFSKWHLDGSPRYLPESDGKRIGERLHEDLQEFDTPRAQNHFYLDYRARVATSSL
jgi:hypothetical protein